MRLDPGESFRVVTAPDTGSRLGEEGEQSFQSGGHDPTEVPSSSSLLPQSRAPQSMWHSSEGHARHPTKPPGHAPASPAEAWGLELGTAEPDVGEGQVDQTGQGQLKVTGIKAEAQLWWTTPALGTAPPAPTVSVGIRGHGVSKMAVASTVEPHHTPSGPAQATYTGPTSCHDEAREGLGPGRCPPGPGDCRTPPTAQAPERVAGHGPVSGTRDAHAGRLCPVAAS